MTASKKLDMNFHKEKKMSGNILDLDNIDEGQCRRGIEEFGLCHIHLKHGKYDDAILARLDALCAGFDDKLVLNLEDAYEAPWDLGMLSKIPNVKSLAIHAWQGVSHAETLAVLGNLQMLFLDIYKLKEAKILSFVDPAHLERLTLYATQNCKLDLAPIKNMQRLKQLNISEHTTNMEAVGELDRLDNLRLDKIKKHDLAFISRMPTLKRLAICTGSRANINEIKSDSIEKLWVARIRGLCDMGDLSRFKRLRVLEIENHPHLPFVNLGRELGALEELVIIDCKTLSMLDGLEDLPKLRHLSLWRTALDFEDIWKRLPKTVTHFVFRTNHVKTDRALTRRIMERGLDTISMD
jgi:hypothetical protein